MKPGAVQDVVRDSVARWWPDLEQVLTHVGSQVPPEPVTPRSESDVLEEILTLLRARSLTESAREQDSKAWRQLRTIELITRRLSEAGVTDGEYLIEVYDRDTALLHVLPDADEVAKTLVREVADVGVTLTVGRFKARPFK